MSVRNSKIGWTGSTWSPVTGCDKVSPGCDHCYAETIAHRFAGTKSYPNGFRVTLRPERLTQPLKWRDPTRIFVNSMSDLYHAEIPDDYIAEVFAVMAKADWHTFQVLTKRPARMRSLQRRWGTLPNVHLGVSAEDQHWADIRIPILLDTPAAVRFISAEPLLGPIALRQSFAKWMPPIDHTAWATADREKVAAGVTETMRVRDVLQWVIVGGESGHGARLMHPDWARDLRDECAQAGIAFFMKQTGTLLAREWGCRGKGEDPAEWLEDFPQEYPVTA